MSKVRVAVGYARSSGMVNPKSSIPNQISMIEKYCKQHSIYLKTIFVDECKSGTKVNGRTEYLKMKECIQEDSNIDMVIVSFSDRLAREAYEFIITMDEITRLGIEFISIGESLSSKSLSPIHTVMLGIQAETENKQRQMRIRGSMIEKMKEGIYPYKKAPFGYDKNSIGRLIINTKESDLVKDIFNSYSVGKSIKDIVLSLKGNIVLDKIGIKVDHNFVKNLLVNKIYTGNIFKKITIENEVIYERLSIISHPQIISDNLFTNVNQIIHSKKKIIRKKHFHLLSGIFICPLCEKNLYGQKKDNKYICSKCSYKIKIPYLDNLFYTYLIEEERDNQQCEPHLNDYEKINNKIKQIQQKYATASITEENYKRKLKELQDEFNGLVKNTDRTTQFKKKKSLVSMIENNELENLKQELKARNAMFTLSIDGRIIKIN